MQVLSMICKVLTWVALVFVLGMQTLVTFGIANGGTGISVIPLLIGLALLLVSVILFFALPKWKGVPLLLSVLAIALFGLVAWQLVSEGLLLMAGELDSGRGITTWQFVYRHLSPALIPLFMVIPWLEYREQCRIDAAYRHKQAPDSYLGLDGFQLSKLDEDE